MCACPDCWYGEKVSQSISSGPKTGERSGLGILCHLAQPALARCSTASAGWSAPARLHSGECRVGELRCPTIAPWRLQHSAAGTNYHAKVSQTRQTSFSWASRRSHIADDENQILSSLHLPEQLETWTTRFPARRCAAPLGGSSRWTPLGCGCGWIPLAGWRQTGALRDPAGWSPLTCCAHDASAARTTLLTIAVAFWGDIHAIRTWEQPSIDRDTSMPCKPLLCNFQAALKHALELGRAAWKYRAALKHEGVRACELAGPGGERTIHAADDVSDDHCQIRIRSTGDG